MVGSRDLPVDSDSGGFDAGADGSPDSHGRPSAPRRWDIALVIAAGGALGGAARHLLSSALPHEAGGFPWATFLENVSGSLLLGALMVLVIEVWQPRRYTRPFLGVGVLGGYTTFSTYMADLDGLLRAGAVPVALAYLFGTLAAGLAATWLGLTIARRAAGITSAAGSG